MSDFGLTIDESTATPFDLTAHDRRHLSRASDPSRDREGAGQLRPARAPTPLLAGAGWLSWLGNHQPQGPFAVDYAMGNLIGTTEAMTDDANEIVGRRVYTAFGELVSSSFMPYAAGRYGYAGAWGYQEGQPGDVNGSPDPLADLGWLHVGARYYDPAAGRFMQRDPIGIEGGLNTYSYVFSIPTQLFDPDGLDIFTDVDTFLDDVINGKTLGLTGAGFTAAGAANSKWRFGIGRTVNRGNVTCADIYLGWNAGKAINKATQSLTGISLSDGIGNGLYRLWPNGPWSWGL